jgi:hypothetical protein
MSPIVNGYFVFYDDGMPAASQLPLPPHLTQTQAQSVGWVVESFDGRTRPSRRHPSGRCRWLSKPERGTDLDAAIKELTRRMKEHQERWEEDGNEAVYRPPTYRVRNLYTTDVVIL